MHIIVCVKMVPANNEIKIDKETNNLIRNSVEHIINPIDLHALEEALRLKEKYGGRVTVLSMGISSTAKLLRKTIAIGADESILLCDTAFAGSDTLATSYILSMAIKKIGKYDLIICGRQAVDGDTAQVGPELGEYLDIPHATCVKKIESVSGNHLRCHRVMDNGIYIVRMSKPSLITVGIDINRPRYPELKNIIKAKNTAVKVWDAGDIDAVLNSCGTQGSPTSVLKIFLPESNKVCQFIKGSTIEQAKEISNKLIGLNVKINYTD